MNNNIAYVEVVAPYETKYDKVRRIGNIHHVIERENGITVVFADKSAETFSGYAYHVVYNSYEE